MAKSFGLPRREGSSEREYCVFAMNIREVYVSAGAGFVVVLTGAIMTMPGLPKNPAAYNIDVTDNGIIKVLF